jgi:hypothetical protein
MAYSARRPAASKTRSAIPQISWRTPQPAPIVLVSGPEDVCAERAIAGVREYLRAEDASLEVSDVRADDYGPGSLLALTSPSLFGEPRLVRVTGVEKCSDAFLAEAISYLEAPQDGASTPFARGQAAASRSPAPRSNGNPTGSTSRQGSSRRRAAASRRPPCGPSSPPSRTM